MRFRLLLSAALLAWPALAAAAQSHSPDSLDVTRVADGVYVFTQRETLQSPIDGNTTVIINADDVVVVDSRVTPAAARAVVAAIRRLTSKPVRYVVNTHWHGDHHYGNDAFRQAFPGVEFIAHPHTRDEILARETDSAFAATARQIPAAIAARRRALSTGMLDDGTPLPEALRAFYERQIPALEFSAAQVREVRVAPPTLLVTDRLILRRGDTRTIEIRHLGRANTGGDLVVYLPAEGVLITGDVLVAPIPFAFGSFLTEWIPVLEQLRTFPATAIVPGHGPVQRDWAYLDRVANLLRRTVVAVQAAAGDSATLEQVRAAVTLDELRRQFSGDDVLLDRAFRNFYLAPAVQRTYLEVRERHP